MDHIAHIEGLDGRAFHLTDPNPLTAGEVIDIFAQAAHAPQSTVRLPAGVTQALQPMLSALDQRGPARQHGRRRACSPTSASRGRSSSTRTGRRSFDSRAHAGGARGQRHRRPAAARPTPASSGTTGSATSTPTSTATGRSSARRAGRLGAGRRARPRSSSSRSPTSSCASRAAIRGGVSLEQSVRGRIVMVTGASSGIGKAAAMKIADAGGTVLLVARTPEKLEATKDAIETGGGIAHIHRCDLSDFDDIERMAAEVLEAARPRRRPGQQRRAARSAARSRSPTTGRTTSSGRSSSTTSARSG